MYIFSHFSFSWVKRDLNFVVHALSKCSCNIGNFLCCNNSSHSFSVWNGWNRDLIFILLVVQWQLAMTPEDFFILFLHFLISQLINKSQKKKKKSNCGSKFFSKWSVRNLEKSLTDGQQRRGVENYTKSNKKKISYIDKKDVSTKEFTISFF